ncbi:hypothetical protein [[Mycobacterium] zoologicum]|uniref:hypothetical protein n=1 Tax=[Mycobacterium] zoologicum TaxID=2872311 RepID=UPI002C791049|nr:hypothetical protein [Mycolicibacter sp. MYC101]MEB3065666.1 hypothetical protein [Mycolicibacter sp. MYC101]
MPPVPAMLRSLGDALINAAGGKKDSGWKPPRGWMWGLAPIIFAALRVLVVSRGDPETLRALVQNLNATALVLATILPFGAAVSVACAVAMFISKGPHPLFFALVVLTLVLVLFAMPVWQIGASAAVAFTVIAIVLFARFIAARAQKTAENGIPTKPVIILVLFTILMVLCSPFIYLIGWSGMWLPQEHITVAGTDVRPAYILSSGERWTSYMDDDRKVHLVPTPAITHRDAVGSSGSWLDKSLADNVYGAAVSVVRWAGGVCD